MAEKSNQPWVVRDVPEHTRRQVKLYAVGHDMTMARAIEAIVEQMTQLLELHRRVMADDMVGAKEEAVRIQRLLDEPPS